MDLIFGLNRAGLTRRCLHVANLKGAAARITDLPLTEVNVVQFNKVPSMGDRHVIIFRF